MAWIRWRGQTAQLMATVWDHGKSRHQYLGFLYHWNKNGNKSAVR